MTSPDTEALEVQLEEMTRSCIAERASRLAAESRVSALSAEVERLKTALKPFAAYLDIAKFDLDNMGNQLPDDLGMGWVYLTVGDFRRARASLNGGSDHG